METEPVSGRAVEGVQTSRELQHHAPDGTVTIHPLVRAVEVQLGPTLVRVNPEGAFRCPTPVWLEGEPVRSGRLSVGSALECSGHRLLLWDQTRPSLFLRAYTAPWAGTMWPLTPGRHPVGRGGKRANTIVLEHRTVSREHATLEVDADGCSLLAEAGVNPVWVGGTSLAPGERVRLEHGDLVEFGDLLFRFHAYEPARGRPRGLLSVRSLGGLEVRVAGSPVDARDWRSQPVKWLLARLAYLWGRTVPVETVLEELWPDFEPERSRNNLNYTLSTLRQILRARLPEPARARELILRSSATLQLNSEALEEHDVITVQRHLQAPGSPGSPAWEEALERAVQSYAGPFLPECYLEWAQPVRQRLELEVLEAARQLLEHRARTPGHPGVFALATRALALDPCAQWAALPLLQALRDRGSPAEAARVYEQLRLDLEREFGVEPEPALQAEYGRL